MPQRGGGSEGTLPPAALVPLERGSEEWQLAVAEFRGRSLDAGVARCAGSADCDVIPADWEVLAVERVEAPALWVKYVNYRKARVELQRLDLTAGPTIEVLSGERVMKHGSGACPPEQIVGGVGVDPRFAHELKNMHGPAAYFSDYAEYSNRYCFSQDAAGGGKVRKLFLCKVCTGRTQVVPKWSTECRARKHPDNGFDSVRGDVGGGYTAIMTYTPESSYPLYVVTYRY